MFSNSFKTIVLVFSIVLTIPIYSQINTVDKGNILSSEYDRFAFTYIVNDYRVDKYKGRREKAFTKVKIEDKYFNNLIPDLTLSQGAQVTDIGKDAVAKKITDKLINNHVPNEIMSKWFNRQSDGSLDMKLIAERGRYNASMADIEEAMMSKRGLSIISDAGEKLIGKSYVLVFDFMNIKTMQEIAKEKKKKPGDTDNTVWGNSINEAKKIGYEATVNAYLYKVEFNDSIAAMFYNNLWASSGQSDLGERKEAFNNFDFPIKLVRTFSVSKSSDEIKQGYKGAPSKPSSDEKLFNGLILGGVEKIKDEIEKMEMFAVRAWVIDNKPVKSKIGQKEGLFIDQKYFVYENRGDKKTGEITKSKKMAVVRAKKVVDNRKMATADLEPSQFYQIGGRTIRSNSMFMVQHNDAGVGLSFGWSSGAFSGIMARLEANIGQMSKSTGDFPTGLKLYLDGGFSSGEYTPVQIENVEDNSYYFYYVSGGLGRELYFARYFQLMPYIGYALEIANWTDENTADDDNVRSLFGHGIGLGATFGINLLHNVHIKYSGNLHFPMFFEDEEGYLNVDAADIKWTDLFEGHSGLSQFIQIRFLF